jgi:hypothetical protein
MSTLIAYRDTYAITAAMRNEAAAYTNPETGECMRKVTVWTHPTTGQAIRRYRATTHIVDPGTINGHCAFCGHSIEGA